MTVRSKRGGTLKPLVEYLVRELVDHPDQVTVSEVPGAEATTYEVRVAPGDEGQVIGNLGRTAEALRVLIRAIAQRDKGSARLDILTEPP